MLSKLIRFYHNNRLFTIILALIAILRLSLVPELFSFGIDEEYQSLLAWSQVKDFHPIWIGTSMADTGFYLGPGIVYLHSVLLALTHGDPVSLAYAAAILGILTTATLFFVTKNFFGEKAGVVAMIVYGLSPFTMAFDRRFWNPSLVPIISVLIFFSIVKAFRNDRWWIAVAFLLGVIVHIHASLFVYFLIIPIIFLGYKKYTTSMFRLSTLILSCFIFLAVYSPLIVYDLAKNFENLKTPLRLLARQSSAGSSDHGAILISTLSKIFNNEFSLFIDVGIVLLLIISTAFAIKYREKYQIVLLWTVSFLYMLLFLLYPGKIHDYYLLGVIPLVIMLFSNILSKIPNLTLVILLSWYALFQISIMSGSNTEFGLATKKKFIQSISTEISDRPYYLKIPKPYLKNGGWRYLFQAYAHAPVQSTADEMFGWIYPDEISDRYEVTVWVSNVEPKSYSKKVTEGPFTAYIIEK